MLLKRWLTAVILLPLLLWILLRGTPLLFTSVVFVISLLGVREYFRIVPLPADGPELRGADAFRAHSSSVGTSKQDVRSSFSDTSEKRGTPHLNRTMKSSSEHRKKFQYILTVIETVTRHLKQNSITGVTFVAYVSTFCLMLAAHLGSLGGILLVPVLNVMLLTLLILVAYTQGTSLLHAIEKQIQGVLYVPFFLSFLVLVRNGDKGGLWILWVWLIVAASDTGAFYWGSYHGKRPLSPLISPNKTIEGALGGLALALVVGVVFELLFIHDVSLAGTLAFSLTAAVAGQVGDLFESALKRAGGIKDSGRLLPGHGGVLDRLDGVIFAAPVAYFFKGFLL